MWKTYDPLARVGFFNPKEAVDGAEPEIRHCPREQIPRAPATRPTLSLSLSLSLSLTHSLTLASPRE